MDRGIKITGNPPETLILLIICIIPIIRKYTFGTFENWTIKFKGMKFQKLYFEVCIELSQTYLSGMLVIILRFGILI